MNRRKFLTLMGSAGLASTAIGTLPEAEAASVGGKFSTYPDSFSVLHDTTRCIGCRRCEMGCQKVNDLPLPKQPLDDLGVLDKKRRTSADAWTVVNKYKVGGKDVFRKTQCNHCLDPACAAACFVRAFQKDPSGAVTYDKDLCVGCRYCMIACPFNIPGFQYYEPWHPYVRKCTLCLPRLKEGKLPGCVQACPMDALTFGKRADILKLAKKRIEARPDVYQHHVYGEFEAGGTNWLYISGAPFSQVGLDEHIINRPYAELTAGALGAVPMVIGIWPVLLGGAYMISKRRESVAKEEIHEAEEKARAGAEETAGKKLAEIEAANLKKLAKVEADAAKKLAAAEAAAAAAATPAQDTEGAGKGEGEDA
ncbi:MAG: 4Fe-4S binding protein [Betaproteobacteria bacterium]|nr:4Fe-4S binding protein [Betaproteobacteria bacterium]